MDYDNKFSWPRDKAGSRSVVLSAEDISDLCDLIAELRELTLSRATYSTATDFLRRFGVEVDETQMVRPEQVAH